MFTFPHTKLPFNLRLKQTLRKWQQHKNLKTMSCMRLQNNCEWSSKIQCECVVLHLPIKSQEYWSHSEHIQKNLRNDNGCECEHPAWLAVTLLRGAVLSMRAR